MFRTLRATRHARRSTFLAGAVGAAAVLSLLSPTAAFAAESNPKGEESSQSSELTPEQIASVTDRQITAANSGTEKFSSADLMEKVRKQIEADYEAREKKRAEEAAAKAKAEEEARIAAEEAARVEAERIAAEEAAAEASRKFTQQYSAPSDPAAYSGGGSKDEWLRAAGIAESDWAYVDYIVSKESGWNPNAVNKGSGASGLVQALPCGKVPGSCFNPVDNLKWADGYAKGRYGSWEGAYSFWTSNHWW